MAAGVPRCVCLPKWAARWAAHSVLQVGGCMSWGGQVRDLGITHMHARMHARSVGQGGVLENWGGDTLPPHLFTSTCSIPCPPCTLAHTTHT